MSTSHLTNFQIEEIYQRLQRGLNDDGLRAWYPTDIGALLKEVYALRSEVEVLRQLVAERAPGEYVAAPVRRPRGRPRKVLTPTS